MRASRRPKEYLFIESKYCALSRLVLGRMCNLACRVMLLLSIGFVLFRRLLLVLRRFLYIVSIAGARMKGNAVGALIDRKASQEGLVCHPEREAEIGQITAIRTMSVTSRQKKIWIGSVTKRNKGRSEQELQCGDIHHRVTQLHLEHQAMMNHAAND